MNRDLAFVPEGRLPAGPADLPGLPPPAGTGSGRMQHHVPQLDLPTLLKIVREWRWLILAAAVLGLVGGIILTMLTTPLYRAWVTLEVNPPRVQVLGEGKELEGQGVDSWEFLATQVGLLKSRAVAERAAQDLNLATNPAVVGTGGSVDERLRAATGVVAGGLNVEMPESGTLIRFSYTSTDPRLAAGIANGVAESFINAGLQRRFESSAYARQFLERQIAKTRSDLERSEQQLAQYAQAQESSALPAVAAAAAAARPRLAIRSRAKASPRSTGRSPMRPRAGSRPRAPIGRLLPPVRRATSMPRPRGCARPGPRSRPNIARSAP